MKEKIAFVCQRYGGEVNGGAEAECRMYAERLTPYFEVEVLTTCALDYVTWENCYPEGTSVIGGVSVRRFPVKHKRQRVRFGLLSRKVIGKHTMAEEERWVDAQGPFCPELVNYLERHGKEYKTVIFMTYLYYPTIKGIAKQFNDTVFIPTAHDEWPIYLRTFDGVFDSADKYIYNADGEKRFVEKRFPFTAGRPGITVGAGVEYPEGDLPLAREKFNISGRYICYSGRIDESKGCKELFEYFIKYKESHTGDLKLVLTGKAAMDMPKREDIIHLGFVSEEEKFAVMKEAEAFVLASRNESLSIVVLESLMMGTPVLVSGHCEVLKDHCANSGAGFYYMDYPEFETYLDKLLNDKDLYSCMQENGRKYVEENYNWDVIINKIKDLIMA